MNQIKSILTWIFGSSRKDVISSFVALCTFLGMLLNLLAKKELSASDILLGISSIANLILTGKSANLLDSGK
jgi:hypothetical protein